MTITITIPIPIAIAIAIDSAIDTIQESDE